MSTQSRPEGGAGPVSVVLGCAVVGWALVYNLMRLTGSTPAQAGWVSLAAGAGLGVAVYLGSVLLTRRLAAAGRVVRQKPAELPSADRLTDEQRTLVAISWPALLVLAGLALAMGAVLGLDWYGSDPADRATTLLVLSGWNLLVALWVGDEALRLRRGEAEGIESVALGAALTAILAAIGATRDYLPAGQVALIVVAGLAGAVAAAMVWRLRATRTPPVAAPAVLVTAVISLVVALA
ncbi:MAG: hypothetical protein RIB67_11375 [Miltoncostaeaceae bacterium]